MHCIFCVFYLSSVQLYVYTFLCIVSISNCFLFTFLFYFPNLLLNNLPMQHLHARRHTHTVTFSPKVLIIAWVVFHALHWFVRCEGSMLIVISQYHMLFQSVKPVNRKYSNFDQDEICTSVHNYFVLGVSNSLCVNSSTTYHNKSGMY